MKENLLIWVNENDKEIGFGEKMETHKSGQLHRAFSVFIFDVKSKKMLIQKRAVQKYHSGGLWSNTCCSHPYKEETWCKALKRCMSTELGINPVFSEQANNSEYPPDIQYIGKFKYYSQYEELSEHEIDYVFLYLPDEAIINSIAFNKDEIEEIKWISLKELDSWLLENPEEFSAWFSEAYILVKKVVYKWNTFIFK